MQGKIYKASNVKKEDAIYRDISKALSEVDTLNYVKIYNGRIKASSELSKNGKKEPITEHSENATGVELLIDKSAKVVQFFSITSSTKGSGRKIVKAVVESVPPEWNIVVVMDWSGGFWDVMRNEYPRIVIL